MLFYLRIKNFALIDELNIEFEDGLNVITGETGRADLDTYIGRLNDQITTDLQQTSSSYTIPFTDTQLDVLLEDKKYKNRDWTKDRVSMTDAVMDGKVQYQLTVKDSEGKIIGSEFIAPNNQEDARDKLATAGEYIYNQGASAQNNYLKLLHRHDHAKLDETTL